MRDFMHTIVGQLDREIAKLQAARSALVDPNGTKRRYTPRRQVKQHRRTMSAEAKHRISEAQKAIWRERRKKA